jgi:putative ABC transport system permease protein
MLTKDLQFAFRMLRKTPVFAITAIITIGLGIGACTAIFSVTNTVLLRPLPYKEPDRLVLACDDLRQRNVKDFLFSNADFLDLRQNAKTAFEDFGSVNTGRRPIPQADGSPEEIRFANVSTNFFHLMGAPVAAGRDFEDSDGTPQPQPPANAPAAAAAQAPQLPTFAILSYGYFQRRFGGNRSAIGQPLKVPGGPDPIIVGVLAPGFELLFPPESNEEQFPDIWFANRIPYDQENRNQVQWRVIGRMKPGVTVERAQAEADTVTAQLHRVSAIARTAGQYIRIEPMKQHLVSEVRPAVIALMGAVVFLLLIACANVANLMLVRGSLRERELAVRTALGGNYWQLIRQMLAEAVILAGCGTALGVGLAWAGIQELLAIAPENLPRLDAIHIDGTVLAFSALAGLAAAALFGIVPALRSARPDVMHVLRASGRTPGLGGGMLRNSVVVLEVALCFVLLTGSGLMVRSFLAIQRVNLGFDPHNLLTFQVLGNQANTPQARAAYERQMRDRLAAIPGVRTVAAAFPMPLGGNFFPIRWGTDEAMTDASKFQAADVQIVLPGYFEAMRTQMIAGRTFTDADNTPDRAMLIIDQALALKAFGTQSAVGKRILFRARTPEPQWGEIVGVVAHQREVSLSTPGREQIFVTDGYMNSGAAVWWGLRTMGDPTGYAGRVRDEVRRFDSSLLVNRVEPMDSLVVKAQAGTRFSLLLIGLFAGLAAVLAAVGLYGVLTTVVRQRTAEIGVRMAVGAPPARVFGLVVGYGLRLFALGIGIGLVAAVEVTQTIKSLLIQVKPTDPATYATMAVLFFVLAAVVSWMPARRAAALDPVQALREE